MATHSGSEGKVFIGETQVAEVKSWSMEVTADTVDASTIGTEWRKNQATIKSWAGSFDAFWDEEDIQGQGALTAGKTVILNLYPEGDEEGSNYFTGKVIITSISYKASFDGLVEAGFSFTGTDALHQRIVGVPVVEIVKIKPTPKPIVTEIVLEESIIQPTPVEVMVEEKLPTQPKTTEELVEELKQEQLEEKSESEIVESVKPDSIKETEKEKPPIKPKIPELTSTEKQT